MSYSIIIENTLPYLYFISSICLSNYLCNLTILNQSCKETKSFYKQTCLENEVFLLKQSFNNQDGKKSNKNIHESLYDYKTFSFENKDFLQLEKEWTKRILFQSTNYGNIIMYYDLYRQAFVHYSDSHISYPTLNKCAMKYVRLYSCRDFFVDTQELPDEFINPFNQMKEDEIEREKEKQREKRKKQNLQLDQSVFITKKKETKATIDTQKLVTPEKTVYKNNFRYLGKIVNYSFLQSVPKKKTQQPQLSKTSPISEHYDYISYKDSLHSPEKSNEPSPFYQKFEQLLI